MPLNRLRTRAAPGPGGGNGAARSSTAPGLTYHSARAIRGLSLAWGAIMLPLQSARIAPLASATRINTPMSDSLDAPTATGALPPPALSLTTPTGLQSIDALTRRRRLVFGLNLLTYAALMAWAGRILGAGGWTVVDVVLLAAFALGTPWAGCGSCIFGAPTPSATLPLTPPPAISQRRSASRPPFS